MPDDDRAPPRAGASLLDAVRAAAARGLLAPGERVLVAVSGGPDSVALLHALVTLRPLLGLELVVCHVHHGLRPEADADAAHVEALARRLGCAVRMERVAVAHGEGRSPEEAARAARHAALARVARQVGARRVALGHTADDQAETVLMRLLQGAGPRGLAGIPARRGALVRPLLEVDRVTVEAYLRAQGLDAVTDATNRDRRFLRNRVRHDVLPALAAQVGFRVPEALRRVARTCRETVEALDGLVGERLRGRIEPTAVGWRLPLAALEGMPPGALKVALRLAVTGAAMTERLAGGLRAAHLDALTALVAAAPGARVRLPGGVSVERGRDALWLLGPPPDPSPAPLPVPGAVRVGAVTVRADLVAARGGPLPAVPSEAWFDVDALGSVASGGAAGVLLLRPQPGERLVPFGGARPVRIRRLLAGAGVPRSARARWPVVARVAGDAADEILWVPGIRRAAVAPVTAATGAVLRLRLEPGPVFPPDAAAGRGAAIAAAVPR